MTAPRMTDERFNELAERYTKPGKLTVAETKELFDELAQLRAERESLNANLRKLGQHELADYIETTKTIAALRAERETLREALTTARECIMRKIRADGVAAEGAGRPASISFHLTSALAAIEQALTSAVPAERTEGNYRQEGDSDRCVGCGGPAGDYCAAQCVGPFMESGCYEAIWLCAECVRRDENADKAIRAFWEKHEEHVPSPPRAVPAEESKT